MRKPVLVFDVIETLIDMSALDPEFARMFGDASTRKVWFRQLLELFLAATVIGRYRSFDKLTADALQMVAAQRGVTLSDDDRARFREAVGGLPAYPDVRPGLERLRAGGFRLAALTNSTEQAATRILERAGLRPLFERILSADAVERYKPAREAYAFAAKELGVAPDEICLVAAHAWDVAGAQAAGCQAAFIARPEKVPNPGAPQPGIVAADIQDLAERLLAGG